MLYRNVKLILGIILSAIVSLAPVFGQAYDEDFCHVYVYPHKLNEKDQLRDGPSGAFLKITGESMLLWVDLEPGMKYTHPTNYILISEEGTRIEEGKWWPVLNEKQILINEMNQYTTLTPFALKSATSFSGTINVHIYPHELTLRDRLVDGPSGNRFNVYPNSLFVWIDLMPTARFAHPVLYLLISKHGSRVFKGSWWPLLNDKQICYGENNPSSTISPFKVKRLLLDSEMTTER